MNEVHELDVETHTSYDVEPELAPQLSVAVLLTCEVPFAGDVFEKAPGGEDAGTTANVHHVPPSATVSPAPFVARASQ